MNVFDLLVKTLLANTVNPLTNRTLAEDWTDIQPPYPRRNATGQIASLESRIEIFNNELDNRLAELRPKASEILGKFGHNVAINFDFTGVKYNRDNRTLDNQEILLRVELFDRAIPRTSPFPERGKVIGNCYRYLFFVNPDSARKPPEDSRLR